MFDVGAQSASGTWRIKRITEGDVWTRPEEARDLHELDLNLLVVFNRLLFDRRVSKVADILGGSQPAVRSSLAKLRKLIGNDLFVRTPKGMEPTPYAD